MAKNLIAEVYDAGFTGDPSAVGHTGNIGALLLRRNTTEIWQKIGALDTDWALYAPGGGSVINEIWAPRIAAHAADDEFDQAALDAQWSQTGFGGNLDFANRPNPYVNPLTNRASWENRRDPDNSDETSWLRIQPGIGDAGLWLPLDSADFGGVVPANLFVWARLTYQWRNASAISAFDSNVSLSFFVESGGGFNYGEHATMSLNNTSEGTATQIKPLLWGRTGGVIAAVTEGEPQNAAVTNQSAGGFYSGYVGIQKIGNNYHGWVFDDGGTLYMGTCAAAGVNAFAIHCAVANTGNPGVMMTNWDFVRFYEGADWIP